MSGELLVMAKLKARSSAVSVFCCSGKLCRLREVPHQGRNTVPVETNCTQIGGCERNVWGVEDLYFGTTLDLSEPFELPKS
jgi:hypothetical protein